MKNQKSSVFLAMFLAIFSLTACNDSNITGKLKDDLEACWSNVSHLSVVRDQRKADANDAAYAGACDFIFPVCSDDAVTRGRELLASGKIGGGASGQYWYWYVMKALGFLASIFMLPYMSGPG